MRTEYWILLCALFATAAFFAGMLYGEAQTMPTVASKSQEVRELEMLVDSMERREAKLQRARGLGVEPNLPPKHVPPGGKVTRE